jgi:hypothetical protein
VRDMIEIEAGIPAVSTAAESPELPYVEVHRRQPCCRGRRSQWVTHVFESWPNHALVNCRNTLFPVRHESLQPFDSPIEIRILQLKQRRG